MYHQPPLTREKFLTDSELSQLRSVIKKYPCRDSTLIHTYIATGARASEVLNIHISDLDLELNMILIKGLKGSNNRRISISSALLKEIHTLALANEHGKPFPIGYKRVAAIWQEYRPCNKPLRSLRHSFGVGVYKATKDIYLVQKSLGHRSITNTMIYMDYVQDNENSLRVLAYTDK